jgi:hypothetical protein
LKDLPKDIDPVFNSIRIDNGQVVATNRSLMAIENVYGMPPGIIHVVCDPMLVAQCVTESKFDSRLTITVTEALKFAVAKTTLGYIHPGNCCYWPDGVTPFDRWREVVMQSKEPAAISNGGMFWESAAIARLAATSPSGRVVFEEHIDTSRPSLIRDVMDYDWLGVFSPFSRNDNYVAASMPTWMK